MKESKKLKKSLCPFSKDCFRIFTAEAQRRKEIYNILCVFAFLRFNSHLKFCILKLMQNRIEIFKQMLEAEPENTMVMFGLAKEYEKLGQSSEVIALLETYLANADDEGNAYGMLAKAYEQNGEREKAMEIYRKGIEVSNAHGHPSMANDYQMTLDLDYAD